MVKRIGVNGYKLFVSGPDILMKTSPASPRAPCVPILTQDGFPLLTPVHSDHHNMLTTVEEKWHYEQSCFVDCQEPETFGPNTLPIHSSSHYTCRVSDNDDTGSKIENSRRINLVGVHSTTQTSPRSSRNHMPRQR